MDVAEDKVRCVVMAEITALLGGADGAALRVIMGQIDKVVPAVLQDVVVNVSAAVSLGGGEEADLVIVAVEDIAQPVGVGGAAACVGADGMVAGLVMLPVDAVLKAADVVVGGGKIADLIKLQRFVEGGDAFLLFFGRGGQHGADLRVGIAAAA